MSKYSLDTIVAWAKRKGFVYPNSEIYWWLANAWDYGPYWSLLKKNISDLWIKTFVTSRDDMVLMDTAIIANPQTWVASWHVGNFKDPLIDDKTNGQRFRADKIIEDWISKMYESWKYDERSWQYNYLFKFLDDIIDNSVVIDWADKETEIIKSAYEKDNYIKNDLTKFSFACVQQEFIYNNLMKHWVNNLIPESRGNEKMHEVIINEIKNNPETGKTANWTEVRNFNMMLQTQLGVTNDNSNQAYLRPETCQSLFTNFKNLCNTTRIRIPFGMAQVGKAFRNEITPGQFLYRTREFEQMEIEYFVENDLEKSKEYFAMRKDLSMNFWQNIVQLKAENLKFREHEKDELSFYSAGTFDVEYLYPRGWGELQGIANRTDYDLTQHQNISKQDLQYNDPKTWARYIPFVIEPSFGLSRTVMAVMMDCYCEETIKEWDVRTVVKFPFDIAPIKFAVLPLVEKSEEMVDIARQLTKDLKMSGYNTEMDISGNIGKRYRRQDEIGTPYCICIDHQTLEDWAVTVRDRDTMTQATQRILRQEIKNRNFHFE